MWKIPNPEQIEKKRARDRERLARLRSDPEYRAVENADERLRWKADPSVRARHSAKQRQRRSKLSQAAE